VSASFKPFQFYHNASRKLAEFIHLFKFRAQRCESAQSDCRKPAQRFAAIVR
jgi:hypothetical protein